MMQTLERCLEEASYGAPAPRGSCEADPDGLSVVPSRLASCKQAVFFFGRGVGGGGRQQPLDGFEIHFQGLFNEAFFLGGPNLGPGFFFLKGVARPWVWLGVGSSGPVVLWSSGLLVLWSSGFLGPVVLWSSGPGDLWSSGPPVFWSSGPAVLWSSGPVVFWSSGLMS